MTDAPKPDLSGPGNRMIPGAEDHPPFSKERAPKPGPPERVRNYMGADYVLASAYDKLAEDFHNACDVGRRLEADNARLRAEVAEHHHTWKTLDATCTALRAQLAAVVDALRTMREALEAINAWDMINPPSLQTLLMARGSRCLLRWPSPRCRPMRRGKSDEPLVACERMDAVSHDGDGLLYVRILCRRDAQHLETAMIPEQDIDTLRRYWTDARAEVDRLTAENARLVQERVRREMQFVSLHLENARLRPHALDRGQQHDLLEAAQVKLDEALAENARLTRLLDVASPLAIRYEEENARLGAEVQSLTQALGMRSKTPDERETEVDTEDYSSMSRDDVDAHYAAAMLNWNACLDELAALRAELDAVTERANGVTVSEIAAWAKEWRPQGTWTEVARDFIAATFGGGT